MATQHISHLRRELGLTVAMVAVADLFIVVLSNAFGWMTRFNVDVWSNSVELGRFPPSFVAVAIVVIWMVSLVASGAYQFRIFGDGPDEFRVVARATVIAALAIGMSCYLAHYSLSRGYVLLTFFAGGPLLLLERYILRKWLHLSRRHGRLCHRVLVVGEAEGIVEITAILERQTYVGYRVVGACVAGPDEVVGLGAPVFTGLDKVLSVADEVSADTVLVARGVAAAEVRRVAWELEYAPIDLVVVPSITDVTSPRIQMRPVAGLPLLHLERPTTRAAGGWPKRLFDVLGSAAILLLASPFLLLVALAIKLDDRGPVLFKQERIGVGGQRFRMLKFRSMHVDAEARLEGVRHLNESDGVLFKVKQDPRVTGLGRFMRKYSLDELPQLFNVLAGSMSMVGPRPPLPTEVALYEPDAHRRLAVRPGITGLWQVSGRSDLTWEDAVRLDLFYVDNWSLMTDLVIMFKTFKAVLAGSGAY